MWPLLMIIPSHVGFLLTDKSKVSYATPWCSLSKTFQDYSLQETLLNWQAFIFPPSWCFALCVRWPVFFVIHWILASVLLVFSSDFHCISLWYILAYISLEKRQSLVLLFAFLDMMRMLKGCQPSWDVWVHLLIRLSFYSLYNPLVPWVFVPLLWIY